MMTDRQCTTDCECCLLPVVGAPGQQLAPNRTESQLHNYYKCHFPRKTTSRLPEDAAAPRPFSTSHVSDSFLSLFPSQCHVCGPLTCGTSGPSTTFSSRRSGRTLTAILCRLMMPNMTFFWDSLLSMGKFMRPKRI